MNGYKYGMHEYMYILLAIYSEATACMRQLMCTAVSQLRSDQLVPLHHHHAHFMYPACLFFLYMSPESCSCTPVTHTISQLHTCPYTVVNLLACCPNT
jgi:hypothetical protein